MSQHDLKIGDEYDKDKLANSDLKFTFNVNPSINDSKDKSKHAFKYKSPDVNDRGVARQNELRLEHILTKNTNSVENLNSSSRFLPPVNTNIDQ